MTKENTQHIIEAVLLCAHEPLSVDQLQQILEPLELSKQQVEDHLHQLQLYWSQRGLYLERVASGWAFRSQSAVQPYISRLFAQRPVRYSRAALEVLAIIAWRQPVTRGDIEDIRGVSVSSQILRNLEDRGWIEILGYRDAPGRPALFGTTKQFLDDLGLVSLQDLPPLESIDPVQEPVQ
ncbi:MAG TPA: SMC-Scp complex subunit ScpB [Paenalcaligenes sp.]|nr:SMC-Scp complex subunit ScpB [Paenalcaligenes sp.]